MPFYVAETREQAYADVAHGLSQWIKYFGRVAPSRFGETDLSGTNQAEAMAKAGRAMIGTPDDAIEAIERLQKKQGDFGVILHQAVNWASFDKVKKSCELYAR